MSQKHQSIRYHTLRYFSSLFPLIIDYINIYLKGRGSFILPRPPVLFFTEGHTIGTLVHSGIALMGTHQNTVQRTEVGIHAMMGTLRNGTFNSLICVTIHCCSSFPCRCDLIMTRFSEIILLFSAQTSKSAPPKQCAFTECHKSTFSENACHSEERSDVGIRS